MNAVSIVTISLAAIYLLITHGTFGPLPSISESRYKWLTRNYSEAFTIFCAVVAGGAFGQTFLDFKHTTKLLLALAGFSMFCVAIASLFKKKKVGTIHYAASVVAILLGFAALSVEYWGTWKSWVPVSAFFILSAITRKLWPQWTTYLVEVYAIILIFTFL